MTEEEILLQKHLKDLAERSYRQDTFTFTGFLSLADQQVYFQMERDLSYAAPEFSGGYGEAERKVLRFGNAESLGYTEEFPITCLKIEPLSMKFGEELSHRDYLGALMNLGVERSVLGDIRTSGKCAYLYCLNSMVEFLQRELTKVRHTSVKVSPVEDAGEIAKEEPKLLTIQVASPRADAVLSKIYGFSRSEAVELFQDGKVFLNGRLLTENAKQIAKGDTLNARGYGKCRLKEDWSTTRKGKCSGEFEVF